MTRSGSIKPIALLISIAALCALLTLGAAAAEYGSFSYETVEPEENESFEPYHVITRYDHDASDGTVVVSIPAAIEKIPVTQIGAGAFAHEADVEEFIIPDSVTQINNGAFAYCPNLKTVVIPDSVTYVGDSAFQGCTALETVMIGSGLQELGSLSFKNCTALSRLTFSEGIRVIESGAFFNCPALKDVVLPDSLTEIESLALGYVQQEDAAVPTKDVTLYCRSENAAVRAYGGELSVQIVPACADNGHSLSDYTLIRTASDAADGLEIAQCAVCKSYVTRPNTERAPAEKNTSGLILLILIVICVLVFAYLVVRYVKSSRSRKAAAIEAYKKEHPDEAADA